MFDPMTAIGIGSSLLGGLMGGSASKKAAKAQQQSAAAAQQEIGRQYNTTRGDLAPWRESGTNALSRLSTLLGIQSPVDPNNPPPGAMGLNAFEAKYDQPINRDWTTEERKNIDDAYRNYLGQLQPKANTDADYGSLLEPYQQSEFEADPGYLFRQQEGNKAIENSAAARGMQLSGANLKGLQKYNSGLASQEYGNWFNRDQSLYGRHSADRDRTFNYLSGTSGQGLNATAQTGAFGAQAAGSTADLMTQGGNAQAAGIVGGANAFNNAFGDINSQMQYTQMMNLLRGGSGANASPTRTAAQAFKSPPWPTSNNYGF